MCFLIFTCFTGDFALIVWGAGAGLTGEAGARLVGARLTGAGGAALCAMAAGADSNTIAARNTGERISAAA